MFSEEITNDFFDPESLSGHLVLIFVQPNSLPRIDALIHNHVNKVGAM